MARRRHFTLTVALALVVFLSISYFFTATSAPSGTAADAAAPRDAPPSPGFSLDLKALPPDMLEGDSIAPKMENATLKAELGRATWKFLHTMAARFPEEPTPDDRSTLDTFIRLFGRLYPCGECARHFRALLAEYPPQTSSRTAAAGWMCFAHNVVNERLDKPVFDCNNIGDFYDCGCGDEDKNKKEGDAAVS